MFLNRSIKSFIYTISFGVFYEILNSVEVCTTQRKFTGIPKKTLILGGNFQPKIFIIYKSKTSEAIKKRLNIFCCMCIEPFHYTRGIYLNHGLMLQVMIESGAKSRSLHQHQMQTYTPLCSKVFWLHVQQDKRNYQLLNFNQCYAWWFHL